MTTREAGLPPVPRFDLGGSPRSQAEIGRALAEHGALFLEGHALDAARLRRAGEASLRAFALPEPVKLRCRGPIDGSQRGYLPMRTRLPDGRETLDRKEAWHARPEAHPAANLFPDEVPELGPSLLALLDGLEDAAGRVLEGVAACLGLPPGHFEDRVRGGDSLLRVNHYPGETSGGARARFLAHQDFDLVTLLFGATGPGLEVETRGGVWRAVELCEDRILVIAGDLLEIESEGKIAATPHRVVSPADRDAGRASMVYFVSPRPEVVLANGESAGDVVGRRLREAGYA